MERTLRPKLRGHRSRQRLGAVALVAAACFAGAAWWPQTIQGPLHRCLAQAGGHPPAVQSLTVQNTATAFPTPTMAPCWCEIVGSGIGWKGPDSVTTHLAVFTGPYCVQCARSERDLRMILSQYPQVKLTRFGIVQDVALYQYLSDRAQAPVDEQPDAPTLFVGSSYLQGNDVRKPQIEEALSPYLVFGAAAPWADWEDHQAETEASIVQRFRAWRGVDLVRAGFLDGLRPFAVAPMFLIFSFPYLQRRRGIQLLAAGWAFAFGVFFATVFGAMGAFESLSLWPFLGIVARCSWGVTAALCLTKSFGYVTAHHRSEMGHPQDQGLIFANRGLRGTSAPTRDHRDTIRSAAIAVALGSGVAVVNLACTGSSYLPITAYVWAIPALRAEASLSLLLYSLMSIAPLLIGSILVYCGTTQPRLVAFLNRRPETVSLGSAMLCVALAGWLAYDVFMF